MKIAVLSDIHSNVFALESVIGDAKRRGVAQLLNLGDIFYGPIAPKATYELLKEQDFVTIRGNQDRQLYEASHGEIAANPTLRFVLHDLGDQPLLWMKSLPFDHRLSDEIYLCHGSPTSDVEYLLENIETGIPCLRSDGEITALLNGESSNIILCGHTHIPRTVALTSGQLIINPGSVGLPAYTDAEPVAHSMETYSPHASYAIIEKNRNGWTVQQINVPYDHQKSAKMAEARHREDWGHFLRTGRGEIT